MPKYDGILPYTGASPNPNNNSPIAINSVSSTNSSNMKLMDTNMVVSQPMIADMEDYSVSYFSTTRTNRILSYFYLIIVCILRF